jgi:hypothetical protein
VADVVERAAAHPARARLHGVQRRQHQIAPRAVGDDGVDRGALDVVGGRADDLEVDRLRLPAARCGSRSP